MNQICWFHQMCKLQKRMLMVFCDLLRDCIYVSYSEVSLDRCRYEGHCYLVVFF